MAIINIIYIFNFSCVILKIVGLPLKLLDLSGNNFSGSIRVRGMHA